MALTGLNLAPVAAQDTPVPDDPSPEAESPPPTDPGTPPVEAPTPDPTRGQPSPTGAMWRAVVPGWGQAYNGRPLKAVIFAAGRLYLAGAAVYYHNEAEDFEQQALDSDDPVEAERLWQQRNQSR